MFKRFALLAVASAVCASAGFAAGGGGGQKVPQPKITTQNSGTTQLLIAVSPVNENVVWASGAGGTYTVTTNGGKTWKSGVVPGADQLQFRDVQGVTDKIAYLLSIGNDPDNFQIYKTEDGGNTWKVQFTNQNPNAFYDCFAFWTPNRGLAHSDSVNGVFPELRTTNGGKTWNSIAANMPPALPGEASFSASGTCITTQGLENAWIATGGSDTARILATRDGGNTWHAYDTPLVSNPSAGAVSVAFRDSRHGIVGGGDLSTNDSADVATSDDGGQTWTLTNKPPVDGAIFCLAYVRGQHLNDDGYYWNWFGSWTEWGWNQDWEYEHAVVITAETEPDFSSGPAAWSPDEGHTWYTIPGVSGNWAVAFANPHAGWFVGNNGQILKISFN
jgi:photosystem II stability/assembly factor-like uncharacterized protein